jgi:hypothetical protein
MQAGQALAAATLHWQSASAAAMARRHRAPCRTGWLGAQPRQAKETSRTTTGRAGTTAEYSGSVCILQCKNKCSSPFHKSCLHAYISIVAQVIGSPQNVQISVPKPQAVQQLRSSGWRAQMASACSWAGTIFPGAAAIFLFMIRTCLPGLLSAAGSPVCCLATNAAAGVSRYGAQQTSQRDGFAACTRHDCRQCWCTKLIVPLQEQGVSIVPPVSWQMRHSGSAGASSDRLFSTLEPSNTSARATVGEKGHTEVPACLSACRRDNHVQSCVNMRCNVRAACG